MDEDDEALSWAGESDPTHVAAPKSVVADAAAVSGRSDKPAMNSALLIAFGIIAGVYLLYAVGWGFHGFTTTVPVAGVFPIIMYQFGEFLAIVSPFLWAMAVWILVKKPMWRILWLLIGVALLAPWPFVVN